MIDRVLLDQLGLLAFLEKKDQLDYGEIMDLKDVRVREALLAPPVAQETKEMVERMDLR